MRADPSFIGTVQDVVGATVTVALADETATGLSFIDGEGYRVGQIGGFVRIPLGHSNLYGVISQAGAGAAPVGDRPDHPFGNMWLRVQLVGEGKHGGFFERGVSRHPTIDDRVHIVTESDLKSIYGASDSPRNVSIGHLASAESIPTLINIQALVTRHSAVLGTTGSGKSTTVSAILRALSDRTRFPSARILILDIHGEYSRALSDRCSVFRVGAMAGGEEKELQIPFWALNFEELSDLVFGKLSDSQSATVADAILELKRESLRNVHRPGITDRTVTVDSPVPFSIHKLWLDLHRREYLTVIPNPGNIADDRIPAYVLDQAGNPAQEGDAMSVTPPAYRTPKTTGTPAERVQHGSEGIGIRQQLTALASKLRDRRYGFMFGAGPFQPNEAGITAADLEELLEGWIGGEHPVTILDLSGIPSVSLPDLIGAVLRVVYDALFWSRNLPEGGREHPLLVVFEEAHAYLGKETGGSAASAVRKIAKEGRKYGVGMMIVSQRPSEIDPTILSQCGTFFAMRLSNEVDRGHVSATAPENLKGLFEMLPVLRTGEAIVVGEAVSLPVRTLFERPPPHLRPDSDDARVIIEGGIEDGFDGPGGWNQIKDSSDYAAVLRQWRSQTPTYTHLAPGILGGEIT